jgi:hypothetical protein
MELFPLPLDLELDLFFILGAFVLDVEDRIRRHLYALVLGRSPNAAGAGSAGAASICIAKRLSISIESASRRSFATNAARE